MASNFQVKDTFLWWMGLIYFCAFSSIYFQIPGLYGDQGILPAKLALKQTSAKITFEEYMKTKPTLLWFAIYFGVAIPDFMEIICLFGLLLSIYVMISQLHRNAPFFYGLWFMYLSLYQVGQTFMHFQWDILLLEAGFLAIIVAPLLLPFIKFSFSGPHDSISLWLVKWLFFRLMFASGVVKLTSLCPTWWGLTALNYHFESQCIPTQFSWMFHHFPDWFLKTSVIMTFLIEIPIPFLFFSPIRSLRIFSYWCQVLLQALIILTGNYNFFNLLTLTLAISLLDDKFFADQDSLINKHDANKKKALSIKTILMKVVKFLLILSITTSIIWGIVRLFSIKILKDGTFFAKLNFTPEQFASILNKSITVTIWLGGISLSSTIIYSLYRSLKMQGICSKIDSSIATVVMSCVAIFMFSISMVPHTSVDSATYQSVWPVIKQWHSSVDKYEVTHAYGLFRRMTGVDGRPEIIIEGSNSVNGGWKEYEFYYKPGNVSESPGFVAPHQPRLDWQMWFAALGSYHHNPWFINLINCLLENRKDVINLLRHNPFPDKPPKYIKATLYTYHYTAFDINKRRSNDWWVRKNPTEYLPVLTKDNPSLQEYLQQAGLYEDSSHTEQKKSFVTKSLGVVRGVLSSMKPHTFLWTVCAIAITGRIFS